ncbi:MAG: 2-oxoacid:acceptor oxidoreductase family protein, partial [Anaerolineae bacterium]|nr:2-oxoacid:acceptor oxidoreductase family protein [Anaerolineae bacterium]
NFVAVHQFNFLERYDMLRLAAPGATFQLDTPYPPNEVWNHLPRSVQETIIEKNLHFYIIDAVSVARETGMGRRINSIMQTCFFALMNLPSLPTDKAIEAIKAAIVKTYGKRGQAVIDQNFAAVDATLHNLHKVPLTPEVTSLWERQPVVPDFAPEFIRSVTARMIEGLGDEL